ncbi:MAG: RNA 2',3'-cyclic phosphodiesterase [Clostridiales bacterium]|nr:RNA 2',3'-cyclic phosphodiesterase [Clostridiales bacterium]
MRIFIALLFPENIKDYLAEKAEAIRNCCQKGRFVSPANYHLTLRFLGEIPENDLGPTFAAAEETARQSAPLTIDLTGPGQFKRGNESIIWWGINRSNPALGKLHSLLQINLQPAGYAPEPQAFKPHITLARQASICQNFPVYNPGPAFTVNQIHVMESCRIDNKLTYIPLAGYQFRGQKTEDRGQKTEDRGQKTEDRGQTTGDRGDRGRKMEDRGRETEDR